MAPRRTRGAGVALVNMRELFAHDRIADPPMELAPVPPKEPTRWLLQAGDLLFARQSLTFAGAGKCVLVMPASRDRTFESHIIRVRLDPSAASPIFYYYFFRSAVGRQTMESIVEAVAAAGIRASDLGRLIVPRPPLDEQVRIAGILSTFDDLIDTNDKLIMRLREIQAAAVSRLRLQATSAISLGAVAAIRREKAVGDDETPYLGLEHFAEDGGGISAVGRLGDVGPLQQGFRRGDLLYGRLRPYFRKVDRAGFDGACTGEVWVMRPTGEVPVSWLAGIIASPEFTDFAMAGSEGTKMPRAKWDHVARYPVPLPGQAQLKQLGSVLESTWAQIWALQDESAELRRARDELLPLLMSGVVGVAADEAAT